ncbi:isocitrate lyase/phosphoenolpyruvate mutase family protein [Bacillus paralicheniformis]|nr:isocitrate lyase/phosphoenolpyruvate mutase family protein [Bacillus sp. LB7]MEC1023350.1 isocitrate lyase/phosphoenolpyruvate mutase family protein [Bacillus paralicheniformis]MDN5387534.1 isocitrate lyase/phosphoenolpyruvate mutase family protein [Bacillus sp. LB7]MEC1027823.1 isocitrate lyase/phosphoenolpyruvate mutase family protein [Bacillus paralicheniformis]MEC1035408.1 isocitrate lyase/phosphoenolpyruvate mutase family protein [Bacillus paralicheniformis]MEC1052098.1 isocitrate lyas
MAQCRHSRLQTAVRRANQYRQAGADCIFIPGAGDTGTIAGLRKGISGPLSRAGLITHPLFTDSFRTGDRKNQLRIRPVQSRTVAGEKDR